MPDEIFHDICKELRKFAETTGIKGIGRIVKSTSGIVRFSWLATIIGCLTILLFQLSNILQNYMCNQVTRVNKVTPNVPIFPEVTICNLLPTFNLSSSGYEEYIKQVKIMKQYMDKNNYGPNPIIWSLLETVEYYNTNNVKGSKLDETLEIDDNFLVECNQYGLDLYQPTNCSAQPVLMPQLQKCHRLQLDWSNGAVAAVSVILYVNNFFPMPIDNYNSWIRMSTGTGIRVMIHPRFSYPNTKIAIRASTGSELFVQLQQTNVTRLPAPYGNCTTRNSIVFSESDSFLYTVTACMSLCRQRQKITQCGCLDSNEIFTKADFQQTDGTFCFNISGIKYDDPESLKKYVHNFVCNGQFTADESKCNCPMRCLETEYDVTVSSSQWPNPLYQLSFYKQYIKSRNQYRSIFSVYDDILNNAENQTQKEILQYVKSLHLIGDYFARVTLMFSTETYQVLTDTTTNTWETLVAKLGGTFNLWLGICVPTFAEIIELICSLFIVIYRKVKPSSVDVATSRCN